MRRNGQHTNTLWLLMARPATAAACRKGLCLQIAVGILLADIATKLLAVLLLTPVTDVIPLAPGIALRLLHHAGETHPLGSFGWEKRVALAVFFPLTLGAIYRAPKGLEAEWRDVSPWIAGLSARACGNWLRVVVFGSVPDFIQVGTDQSALILNLADLALAGGSAAAAALTLRAMALQALRSRRRFA